MMDRGTACVTKGESNGTEKDIYLDKSEVEVMGEGSFSYFRIEVLRAPKENSTSRVLCFCRMLLPVSNLENQRKPKVALGEME